MPIPRPKMSILEAKDKLFFIGGGGPGNQHPVVDIYDATTNSWRSQIQLDDQLEMIGGAAIDSKVILIGSYLNKTDEIYVYDINTEAQWKIATSYNFTSDNLSRWGSITVGTNAYFYNDNRLIIVDVFSNTSRVMRNQAGQQSRAATNGTHLILASFRLNFLNLETFEWTSESSIGLYGPMAIFYAGGSQRTLIVVKSSEISIQSLDNLNSNSIFKLKESVYTANILGDAIYLAGQTGVSVFYWKQNNSINLLENVFYQLGSTDIAAHQSIIYNGSIYYTSNSDAVYRLDLQWLFSPMDLNVEVSSDASTATADNGYYFYFNRPGAAIHYYNLESGQLGILPQRNIPESFTREDAVSMGTKFLVLRYPEYDLFDYSTNTWNTSALPYNITQLDSTVTTNYAVFYTRDRSTSYFYLFNVRTHSWNKLDTANYYSSVFVVHDNIAVVTVDGRLEIYDILTRTWHVPAMFPQSSAFVSIVHETSIVIAKSEVLFSSVTIYDLATNTTTLTDVVGPLGTLVQPYGDFIVFAAATNRPNPTIRVNIFNARTVTWNTVDLPPSYSNDPAVLNINNNMAYLARAERVDVISLVTLTVSTIVMPIQLPTEMIFVGNKVVIISQSSSTRIITMYDTTTRTSTGVEFNSRYSANILGDLRATKNYLITKLEDQMNVLEYSALFNSMKEARAFIGQSAHFTANPSGRSFPKVYWEDKYGNILGRNLTLSLNNVSMNDAGTYTVNLFDQCQQPMQPSAQLVVYVYPVFSSILNSAITICNESASVSVEAFGEQVQYSWTLDGSLIPGKLSTINVTTDNLKCQSSHTLCAIATNPSGATKSCASLQVLEQDSIFNGPRPAIDQPIWLSDSEVTLHVQVLNPECTNHTWLMNGNEMSVSYQNEVSEISVHVTTSTENSEFQVEALCANSRLRSRPFRFSYVTSLTPMALAFIIIATAILIVIPVLVSIVYQRRLRRSRKQQDDLENLLSNAKTESIRAKDSVTILQPTTWEWIPSDEYTYRAIENLPFNVDLSAMRHASKNAVEVDVCVQGDIVFSTKQKPRSGVKKPLINNTHVDIYVPKSPKYEITVEPASFDINSRGPVQVTVSSKLRMTAKCNICLIIVCEQDQTYSAVEFKLESKPSEWIDIEEIKMSDEFLGGGG